MPEPRTMSAPANTSLFSAINGEMRWLAADPHTVFVGQSVAYDGARIYDSLAGVPMEKRLEMPVIEDFQLGYCTGLALAGKFPICIYPRIDFMLLAMNQLVNHLDKFPLMGWHPKMIIRTCVGAKTPLDAGPQHTQDHTDAFRAMLDTVRVDRVRTAKEVERAYAMAAVYRYSTLIVEGE